MATLNELATAYIDSVNEPFNTLLRERIKFHIKHFRAKFIRQDFERNKITRNVIMSYVTKLISVDSLDNCLIKSGCIILRTENKVPKPIQLKTSLFQYVGSVNYGNGSFGEITPNQIRTLQHSMFTSKLTRYYYSNDYIYVYMDKDFIKKYKFLRIDAAFEDPLKAINTCTNSVKCLTDDDEFPLSLHMVDLIYEAINRLTLTKRFDDKEVTNDG